ncbi:SDR family NAD(P)-dependent oxidoreductase [Bradyrhizobium sp. LHD-71]|uniref:SDR family NAD(P)-dependent oxidoreductase n=1 Tax=Bradyrhizobium sp. LHD-71 TaxID=3072141 RepID=UPI00280C57F2|nr:SDR family NAD(P)-dependent oxidoreductase [Bradyrhizobium sp. LHD-71]MDQ8728209.1 SDR family oxidoreductase [Bradyrhizobium sp. LHD-71]
MHLKGKTAIVTGAGRGIGRDVALLLAREGATVLVNDPGVGRSGEATGERPADDVVAEIRASGGKAMANYDSVGDHQKAGQMVRKLVEDTGKIDILVNVAGMLRERMIWNMSEEDFDAVINVHLKGHWSMSHHAIKYMRQAGYGRIVNFSSDAFKGSVGQCNYSAAKAGIIGLTRSIAKETSKFGITCNAICPMADTRMVMNDAVIANRKRKLEAGLMTKAEYDRASEPRGPEHIAPMVAFLTTDQADTINGQVFHVEKGRISTYFYGEDMKAIVNDGTLFTIDRLTQLIPGTLMSGIVPVVPPVRMQDAVKSTDAKKAG